MATNDASYLQMENKAWYGHVDTLLLHKTSASFLFKYWVWVCGTLSLCWIKHFIRFIIIFKETLGDKALRFKQFSLNKKVITNLLKGNIIQKQTIHGTRLTIFHLLDPYQITIVCIGVSPPSNPPSSSPPLSFLPSPRVNLQTVQAPF